MTYDEISSVADLCIANDNGAVTFHEPVSLLRKSLPECLSIEEEVRFLDVQWRGKTHSVWLKSELEKEEGMAMTQEDDIPLEYY